MYQIYFMLLSCISSRSYVKEIWKQNGRKRKRFLCNWSGKCNLQKSKVQLDDLGNILFYGRKRPPYFLDWAPLFAVLHERLTRRQETRIVQSPDLECKVYAEQPSVLNFCLSIGGLWNATIEFNPSRRSPRLTCPQIIVDSQWGNPNRGTTL